MDTRGSTFAFVALSMAIAGGLGLLAASLPWKAAAAVVAAGVAVLLIVLLSAKLRRLHRPQSAALSRSNPASADANVGDARDLRGPRLLFYVGAVTLTLSNVRPLVGLTVSELLFLAAFAGCVLAVLRGHAIARLPAAVVAGVCVFGVGGAISSLGARAPEASAAEVLHAVYVLLLWAWTGTMVLRSRRHLLVAVALWTLSAAANAVDAIGQVLDQGALANSLYGTRAKGFMDHANDLGGAAAVALVPALMLATPTVSRRLSVRAVAWVIASVLAISIVLAASVAAILAAAVAIVVWLSSPLVSNPARIAASAAVAAGLLLALSGVGGVISPTERLEQVTGTTDVQAGSGSGETRLQMWKAAWSRIEARPLVGNGFDTEGTAVTILVGGRPSSQAVHGAPVAVWYEGGILALAGLLVLAWGLCAGAWRRLVGATGTELDLTGWALLAAFVGWLVFSLSGPFYFQQYGWIAAVLLVAWHAHSAPARAADGAGALTAAQPAFGARAGR